MKQEIYKRLKVLYLLIVLVTTLCLLVTNINAEQTFSQNTSIDLKVQCIINGTYCSGSAFCNVSILYPNSSLMITNKMMTNQISFYNYTLNGSMVIGEYSCSAMCCDGSLCGTNGCTFNITPNGFILSTSQSMLYIFGLILAVFVFLMLLIPAIKIPFRNFVGEEGKVISVNNFKFLKVGAIAFAYLTLVFIFGLANAITRDYLYTIGVNKFFDWGYWILLTLSYPLIILAIVLGLAVFINDIYVKKKLERRWFR